MSLKTCFRVLPIIANGLKSNRSLLISPGHIYFKNGCASFNLLNQINVRFSSGSPSAKKSDSDFKRVYYGVLTPQIKAVKVFSLSSSIVGIIAQPFLYKEIASTGNVPIILAAYGFIGFFTLVTPILLHFITKRYITELVYKKNTDTYVAETINFFCITKKTEFKTEQVVVPDLPGMFTTVIVNDKPLFFDPGLFGYPEHYARIMGYDKPIDFKLYETSPNEKKV